MVICMLLPESDTNTWAYGWIIKKGEVEIYMEGYLRDVLEYFPESNNTLGIL